MAWYSALLNTGLNTVVDSVGKVLDNLFTSDDEKEKNKIVMAQVSLVAMQFERQLAADLEKAYIADIQDLRKQITVELQSEDAFVRRSRPAFNYIFYTIIVFNYIFIPIYQLITGLVVDPVILPNELWMVFGAGFVGYGFMRTIEKGGFKNETR